MKLRLFLLPALLVCCTAMAQDPDRTILFAQRDTCELLLDFYKAAPDAGPCADAPRKPLIIHIFGGALPRSEADRQGLRRCFPDESPHASAQDL